MVEMHEDSRSGGSLVEEPAPVLNVSEKISWYEMLCVIGGYNLEPQGQIWKSPSLPGMTTVRGLQLRVHLVLGLNGETQGECELDHQDIPTVSHVPR